MMKKKILSIGIIIMLLTTTVSFISIVAGEENEQGEFDAKLGKRGNDRPFIVLDGSYQTRSRYFVVRGTAETEDFSGRFHGVFKDNRFVLRSSIRGITIVGKCRFDTEYQDFTGIWIGRGILLKGWITGTFNPFN